MYGTFNLSDETSGGQRREADRRRFLQLAVGSGLGLAIGVRMPLTSTGGAAFGQAARAAAAFNPFVRITPDNKVVVIVKHLDKGQGAATGLATLIADELDADWAQVTTEFAPANAELYKNLFFGTMGTGGSTAMANSWAQYRGAGAAARQMIIAAAAEQWKLPASGITILKGVVSGGGKTATLGDLAAAAAKMPVPTDATPKAPADWTYIGKSFPRVDAVAKTTAQPLFTQDVQLPDMVTAVIARPPKFGATVKSVDATAAKAIAGVVDVVQIPQGVAVIAASTWIAMKGREALKITWDDSRAETRGTVELLAEYRRLAATPGKSVRRDGDVDAALKGAAKVIEAEYTFPYLAHATMEPMNCVMQFKDGQATVWTGAQLPNIDQAVIGGILGIKPDQVAINTLWAGGSFGRRAVPNCDYTAEVASLVKAWGRPAPVKVIWTREDDIKGGYYRPMVVHKVRAGLDAQGKIVGWQHRIVGQPILLGSPFEAMTKDGIDPTVTEGVADTGYAIPNMEVELHYGKVGVPVLWWRSVGHTHSAYVMETMMDELAKAAGRDPVAFRLDLLQTRPRETAVLKLAAEKAGWGTPLASGVARGVAVHESFKSVVAQITEVRMVGGQPKVDRVVCAVDCGIPINPDNIRSQVEGGIGFGLGAILKGKITLKAGEVEQANFDTYDVLRFDEMPAVETHIIASSADPTGIGEPGVPPIGPAVANAVFALTGRPVRTLPMVDGIRGA